MEQDPLTSTTIDLIRSPQRHAAWLAVLAVACCACRHPGEPAGPPAARPTAAATAAPQPAPKGPSDGDRLAARAGARIIGQLGPAIAVTTIDGETIDLGKLYGAVPVYLKFWATWCVPCREQMPGFGRIHEAVGDRMKVIAVDVGLDDDAATVRAFRDHHRMAMPVVVDDGRLAAALDLQVTPQHVLIGRDGRVAYVSNSDGAELDAAIHKLLADPGARQPVAGRAVAVRPALRPGERVEGLVATALDGAALPLGPSRDGRPRGLVLFASWCESYLATSVPPTSQACRRVREEIDRLIARGDVDWLGIVGGPWTTPESTARYQAKTSTRLPLALDPDGALFRAFGVRQMPTIALLDRDGRLVRILGPDDRDIEGAIRAAQARSSATQGRVRN